MQIKRSELLSSLNKIKSGLAGKEIIEQSSNFIFMDDSIATYNDEIAVSVPFKNLSFTCAVPGAELISILSKTKDEEISVELVEGELQIKGGKFIAKIRVQSEILLPIDTLKPSKWTKVSKDFQDALNMCSFSAGNDMSKPVLTCLHIAGTVVESCDNFRFTRIDLNNDIKTEFLLPARVVPELCKNEVSAFSLSDGWAHFKLTGNVQFSCRTFEGVFPDLSQVSLLSKNTYTLRFPPDMDGILERASSALIKEDKSVVEIEISKNTMKVTSTSQTVRYEESARIRCEKDLVFRINPTFLRQILANHSVAELDEGEGTNPVKKMKFLSDGFEHLLALIK